MYDNNSLDNNNYRVCDMYDTVKTQYDKLQETTLSYTVHALGLPQNDIHDRPV